MLKLSLRDIEVTGKRVFVRVDFNVPLSSNGVVTDDTRIRSVLPTVNMLIERGAKVILASHLGRPKGVVEHTFSLGPVADKLQELLGRPVPLLPDCIGEEIEAQIDQMAEGEVVMLENLRFHAGEEENSPDFAQQLAKLADVYVNDAFGAAHRAHASISGVPQLVQPAVAGLLLCKEIEYLGTALENPRRPFVAILGGAKVSDKIKVIEALIKKVDCLIIGGGMANTFLRAKGHSLGKSLYEPNKVELASELLDLAERTKVEVLLPIDVVVADSIESEEGEIISVNSVPDDKLVVDIGPDSAELFAKALSSARLVIWNGPMGVFENPAFSVGTAEIAQALAASRAITIVGGGDSVAAIEQAGLTSAMSHISTGGGASLEFLEGQLLPGIVALTDKV